VLRATSGRLGMIGLALAGAGALVFSNWGTVSRNVTEALGTQSEKTRVALFRWGELMSISAELKKRYGADPDITYETSTGDRILSIRFRDYKFPEQVTSEGHARAIATFALGQTTKLDEIDVVRVLFRHSSSEEAYAFALNDLMSRPPTPS
jgi:hypothetical protein